MEGEWDGMEGDVGWDGMEGDVGWDGMQVFLGDLIIFDFYISLPAPSKGCQLNPKGWYIDTL